MRGASERIKERKITNPSKREDKQWGHIPLSIWRSIEITNDFTSQKKYKYQSSIPLLIHTPLSVSQSLPLLSNSLYFLSFSLISRISHSHQLLHPKVTANTQYVHLMLHSVMESKIKTFSKFHLSNSPKTHPLINQIKVTSKYPNEFVRLQSFKPEYLSLPLFLPLRSLRSWSEIVYTPWKKGKC